MIRNVIFDLGGVLIDWNPKYLYRKIFHTEEAVNYFIDNICTGHWNEQQDGGRTISEAEEILIAQHPQYEQEIRLYYQRWTEMLGGPIVGTVDLFQRIRQNHAGPVYALTNWSAETWPMAIEIFDFLHWFDGVVVSGQEKMKKPDEAIFRLISERYKLEPQATLFIDDNIHNIRAAEQLGFETVHFTGSEALEVALKERGVGV